MPQPGHEVSVAAFDFQERGRIICVLGAKFKRTVTVALDRRANE